MRSGRPVMRSTPSLRSVPNVPLETVPMFGLIDDGPFLVLSRKIVQRFLSLSTYASLPLQTIDGMMSLVLRRQVVSQDPQHVRSSETQPACDGCFACQSTCSVISFDSGMSRTVHP